jgi:hypothetical protein
MILHNRHSPISLSAANIQKMPSDRYYAPHTKKLLYYSGIVRRDCNSYSVSLRCQNRGSLIRALWPTLSSDEILRIAKRQCLLRGTGLTKPDESLSGGAGVGHQVLISGPNYRGCDRHPNPNEKRREEPNVSAKTSWHQRSFGYSASCVVVRTP